MGPLRPAMQDKPRVQTTSEKELNKDSAKQLSIRMFGLKAKQTNKTTTVVVKSLCEDTIKAGLENEPKARSVSHTDSER